VSEHKILSENNRDDAREIKLLGQQTDVQFIDSLQSQQSELNEVLPFEQIKPSDEGVLVYYPWLRQVVKLLNKDAFCLVRSNRNRNKITREEERVLRSKKIGVIGLSVGRTVAITIAQESSVGELRIADYDTLDLSNLNRIKAPLTDIGLKKTTSVAREIALLDPFLSVQTFDSGVTQENIASFIGTGNQQLDLIIDECDSIDVKVLCRSEAKKRGIPVIMDTSDRGMIDVERYDVDAEYPLFHGLAGDIDMESYLALSEGERKGLTFKILDFDNLSSRAQSSIKEIGSTLLTWPQLAADVSSGGGAAAHISRNILLGNLVPSGRYYIDIDSIIGRKEES